MSKITTQPKNRRVLFVYIISAVSALMLFWGFTTSTDAARDTFFSVAQVKHAEGSVVRTNDTAATRSAMQRYGLREVAFTPLPNGEALITVDSPVFGRGAQLLEQELGDDPDFTIFPNYTYQLALEPNDPLYVDDSQWNLPKISAPSAWDITTGSTDTTVAVIDTGVLSSQSWEDSPDCPTNTPCTQADFPTSKIWANPSENGITIEEGPTPNCTSRGLTLDKSCNNIDDDGNGFIDDHMGWDFMGGFRGDSAVCPNFASGNTYEHPQDSDFIFYDNDPQPYSCDSPTHENELNRNHFDGTCVVFESACFTSHGTAVASVATAATNNGTLVAGADWNAKIMNLRALDGYGFGDSALITAAVEYATEMGADVINLSLTISSGGDCTVTDNLLEDALAAATTAGIMVVAASGNTGTNGVCYPARSSNTIAVGATNSNDVRASFSTFGAQLDVVAPGAGVPVALAPAKSNDYEDHSLGANGTSFAAPHVAGLASLLEDTQPSLKPNDVLAFITRSADKVAGMDGKERTDGYGYGRINAHQTLLRELPDYVPLAEPREMWLTTDTQKTHLLTLDKTGQTLGKGRVITFETKAQIDGIWYLRSAHDTTNGNHLGIPLSQLRNLPEYLSLQPPREMWLARNTTKTHLLTKGNIGDTLSKGQVIEFKTKTTINGILYLRSARDTNEDLHFGISLSDLREMPDYVSLANPRKMKLATDTQKTNLLTLSKTGGTFGAGRVIQFETKTKRNGVWYLRSSYDTSNGNHLGFPLSVLRNL